MGGASKVAEPTGDYLCKKIAVQVQNDLDEYMANNPEFPVSLDVQLSLPLAYQPVKLTDSPRAVDRKQCS